MATYSWSAGLRIISAQLHCILCNTITRRDSNSSWRWEELMLCVMRVCSQRPSTPLFDSRGKLYTRLLQNSSAFTTGRACTPSSDIKGDYCLVPGTTPIRNADAADASRARWLADHVIARCPINGAGGRRMWFIDSRKQTMSATDSGVACTTPFVQRFTLSFANGHIFSDGPWKVTVSIRSVLNCRFGGGPFYWIGPI